MEFGVGSILDGKVTGITKFGAFVSLPEGRSGLVHISEIAYSYVNEVSDHLQGGQEVKVKVIGIDEKPTGSTCPSKGGSAPQRGPAVPRRPPGGGGGRPGGFAQPPPRSPAILRTGSSSSCSRQTASCPSFAD